MCLLDIAKAFPTAPHTSLLRALEVIGTPPQLMALVCCIYHGSWNSCATPDGKVKYKLRRGINEGCPLSPVLVMLL